LALYKSLTYLLYVYWPVHIFSTLETLAFCLKMGINSYWCQVLWMYCRASCCVSRWYTVSAGGCVRQEASVNSTGQAAESLSASDASAAAFRHKPGLLCYGFCYMSVYKAKQSVIMVYRFVLVCLKHTTNNLSLPGSPVGLVFSELHAVINSNMVTRSRDLWCRWSVDVWRLLIFQTLMPCVGWLCWLTLVRKMLLLMTWFHGSWQCSWGQWSTTVTICAIHQFISHNDDWMQNA